MTEIITWTALQTRERITTGEVSVKEVVTAHLDQAALVNPRLNALAEVLHDDAIVQARRLDDSPDKSGRLHGLPVTTKINTDHAGTANSNGLPALAGNVATEDSPLVANMRRDGAVFIGRTNTPEFSLRWFTSNPLHGQTKNPWNDTLTPGGSSGGAAAAIASGVGTIAHGNDLGGSLRYPAYCCGVASIRPSLGRVAALNPSSTVARPPLTQQMSVQGPIARSIADLRLGLQSMSGRDSRDPLWTPATSSGRRRGKPRLRIGYVVNAFSHQDDLEVQHAIDIAVTGLTDAGHELVACEPPQMQRAAQTWGTLLNTETELLMGDSLKEFGSAQVNNVVQAYRDFYGTCDLRGYLEAMQERVRLQGLWSQFFDQFDLVLMPTSGALPFLNDLDFNSPDALPEMLEAQKYLYIINLLGLPAVAVPTHVADRCPLGVQLVAPMYDDSFCLDVAETLEQEIGRPVLSING